MQFWLTHSREVAAWRAQIGAARFDVVTATLWPNPQLVLGTSIVVVGRDHPPDGVYNWGPGLNIPLPVFGQLGAREREAKASLQVTEVSVAATLWARAADLEQALVERAFLSAEIDELERNLQELARIDRVVRAREAAGANPRYDVLRLSTAEATFRAGLAAAKLKRDQAETQLEALIAAPDYHASPVTRAGLEPYRGPASEAATQALALQRRPDLLLAQRGVVAAMASADRFRKEVRPVPSLQLGSYVTHEYFSVSFQGGLSFTLPLFDRNQGLIGRAEATAEGQRALAAAVETRVVTEVRGAWHARLDARQALEAFEASGVGATDELLQRAEVSYQAGGSFSILDLLDAYRAVWDARAQKLALERSLADAETELARASGLLVPAPAAAGH
jgi:outer membrane protein TolC